MTVAYRLAVISVFATLVLIAAGVVVRATGSGLGCPDWPTCHGGLLPPGEKHPVIEVSHRFIAMGVGFLVIALAIACWRAFRDVPFIWILALAIVPAVGIQGILGAITVVRELPPGIVATHLLTAFLILSALIVLALEIRARLERTPDAPPERSRATALAVLVTLAVLTLVVWIGGYLPESGASPACGSWPACNGDNLLGDERQEIIHMLHRYAVAALVPAVLFLAAALLRAPGSVRWGRPLLLAFLVLLAVQIALGALNVWYGFPNALAVSHTIVASLLWALATVTAQTALRPWLGRARPNGAIPAAGVG